MLADQCAAALQPSRASFCIVLVLGCHARVSNEDVDTVGKIKKEEGTRKCTLSFMFFLV